MVYYECEAIGMAGEAELVNPPFFGRNGLLADPTFISGLSQ